MKMVNGSTSLQFHIRFDYMLYTVASRISADPEVWISLVMLSN